MSVKAFNVEQRLGYSVFRCFGIAGIMAVNSFGQILARIDVAPSGLLAQQHAAVKHFRMVRSSRRGERI